MKLIKPSYSIIEPTGHTIDDIYKSIELAGKVSHKSEHNIKEGSAKEFVDRMIKLGHGATLEFGTVYLYTDYAYPNFGKMIDRYTNNKYSKCNYFSTFPSKAYISSNLRVLVENDWLDDLKYLCEPTEYHEKRYTVKFICDRGILAEFTRHRKFSFIAESTRYCNYSKDKFDNELTYICPCWLDESLLKEVKGTVISKDDYGDLICEYYYHLSGKHEGWFEPWTITPEKNFVASLQIAEQLYLELLNQGWKPEQARAVLPLALKTELYMCGFAEDWKHFCRLRSSFAGTGQPHPQSKELVDPLTKEFVSRGYIESLV